jgi:hypothetical protein
VIREHRVLPFRVTNIATSVATLESGAVLV